jgi:uncharacterized surface protein with fasciclin (FAS1) repeats
MKKINNKLRLLSNIALLGLVLFTSCNKDLEQPIAALPTGKTTGDLLSANASLSIFTAALAKTGLLATLQDPKNSVTVFAPDDNAMIAAGYPLATVNTASVATLTTILQYHIVAGKVPATLFENIFPNVRIPSNLTLDAANPFVRMSLFPSKLTANAYVNSTPITATDATANNGIIYTISTVLAPPAQTATLKSLIAGVSNLSYFRAAVTRADSGAVGLSRFDSLLNYNVTNMTVLAPNDAAFKTLVYGLVYAKVFAATGNAVVADANANGAVAAGPAFLATNNVSTADIKGIIAYHLLASLTPSVTTPYQPNIRVFSVNVSSTPMFIKTLVNGVVAVHPGVMARATYTGLNVTSLQFTGLGTFPPGGAPFSGGAANVVTQDKLAVNGVYHIIDKVLLPQ